MRLWIGIVKALFDHLGTTTYLLSKSLWVLIHKYFLLYISGSKPVLKNTKSFLDMYQKRWWRLPSSCSDGGIFYKSEWVPLGARSELMQVQVPVSFELPLISSSLIPHTIQFCGRKNHPARWFFTIGIIADGPMVMYRKASFFAEQEYYFFVIKFNSFPNKSTNF